MAIYIHDDVMADAFHSDYNLLFSEADQRIRWKSASYSSFQSYQQDGHEPHGLMQRDPCSSIQPASSCRRAVLPSALLRMAAT